MTLRMWWGVWAWLWMPVGLRSAGHHWGMWGGVGLGWMEMCVVLGCGNELVPWVVLGLTLCLG